MTEETILKKSDRRHGNFPVRIVALLAVLMLLSTALVITATQTDAAGSIPQVNGFSFPYRYGHPFVPSSIGAQGIQGPDVPYQSLGPQGTTGATGHIGPVNYTGQVPWSASTATVSVAVYDGTLSSRSAAAGVTVSLVNATGGNTSSAVTDSSGAATLSVTEGWFLLQISANAGYTDFTQMVNIVGSVSLTRYLIQTSYGSASVSNGPSGTQWTTVYMEQPTSPFGTGSYSHLPQMEVRLLNASSGNAVLATGYALSNGTVIFTNVNPSYSYSFGFAGYSNDLTGVVYSIANYTEPFTISGRNYVDSSPLNLGGRSSTTGSVSGTAISEYSPNGYSWSLAGNTVVTGGVTYISQKLNLNSYSLKFVNARVYFNESQAGSGGNGGLDIYFINSTVVVLTNMAGLFGEQTSMHSVEPYMDHSILYAASKSSPLSTDAVSLISNNVRNSYLLGYLALAGNFQNDEFIQVQSGKQLSVSSGYIVDSTIAQSPLFGPAVTSMTVFSNDVVRNNASTQMYSNGLGYYNNTNVTYTIPPSTPGYVNFGSGNVFISSTYLSFAPPPDMNINTYLSSVGNINFNTGTVNITKSLMFFNQAPRLPWINLFTGGHRVSLYDDYINENYTLQQIVSQWDYHVIGSGTGDNPLYVNYTTEVTGGLFNFQGNNMTFSHDYFTGLNEINADTMQNQLFGALKHRGPFSVTYSNDTWGYVYANYTLTSLITGHTYNGQGQLIEDMNVANPPAGGGPAYLNVTHVTFKPFFAGNTSADTNTAPVDVLLGEGRPGQVIANVSYNLFENNYSYTIGPDRYHSNPYYWDIVIWAGTGTIYDNYFLNLNEQIVPIGGNNNESGPQGWAGKFQLTDNHFFYSPAYGESHVPLFSSQGIETTGQNTVSAMSYQIPVFYNSTLTSVSGGTYVFNTTHLLSPIPMYSGAGVWVWNITPDVTIQSGSPVVSYQNGLVGGPQPNFTFGGYQYSTSVEPNQTYISTTSSSAPSVSLQLTIPSAGRTVYVYRYTSGQGSILVKSVQGGNPSTTVTVTYTPLTDGLSAVFYASTIPSNVQQYFGFPFPYQYSQVNPPPYEGAQGKQGPTVPLSDIGPTESMGVSGHIGPVNITGGDAMSSQPASLQFAVFNGTVNSHSASSHAQVRLTNITTGETYGGFTSSSGYLNTSLPAGWYFVEISQQAAGYVPYSQQLLVRPGAATIMRYLLPESGTAAGVNNGGSGTIWFSAPVNTGNGYMQPQLYVSLQNATGGSVLASGYTSSNGSVEFTGLSGAYSYTVAVDGYSNPLSGVRYYISNYTTQSYSFSGRSILSLTGGSLTGTSYTTGQLIGSALPAGNGAWTVQGSTSITGGTTYISAPLQFSPGSSLTFSNALVYMNESYSPQGQPSRVNFYNSTVYFLSSNHPEFQSGDGALDVVSSHSAFFGVGAVGTPNAAGGLEIGFVNASYSYFIHLNGGEGGVFGNFYNDVILNTTVPGGTSGFVFDSGNFRTVSNLDHVSIENSVVTGGSSQGVLNFTHVMMSNSTLDMGVLSFNAVQSFINQTWPYASQIGIGQIAAPFVNFTHSTLTFSAPSNYSFVDAYNSISSTNPYLPFVVNGGSTNYMGDLNFSYSIFTWEYPNINVTPLLGGYNAWLHFYNDNFDFNYTQAQADQVIQSIAGPPPFYGARINLQLNGPLWVNYSYMDLGFGAFILTRPLALNGKQMTASFNHNLFPYVYDAKTYSFFRLFSSQQPGSVEFSNNTFQYIYFNYTAYTIAHDGAGFADLWMEGGVNVVWQGIPYINITYNTFDHPSFGGGWNGIAGNIEFAMHGIVGYVAHNVFLNSPKYVLGIPDNYMYWYQPPHSEDILATGANVTIVDNWFMNLTNLTVPIGTDQAYQNGGGGGNLTLRGNHFFYFPAPGGMNYINPYWPYGPGGHWGAYDSFTQGYNGSDITYEIPMGYGTSMNLQPGPGGAYIFNTTVAQNATSNYMINPQSPAHTNPAMWSWAVIPSFTYNGSSWVLAYNGMGGVQPNFTFGGYRYQEALEPNMTYVATGSTSAPSINIAFSLPNELHVNGTVNLYRYNSSSGQNELIETVNAGYSHTNLTTVYNPSRDGTSSIYFANGTGITYATAPQGPPRYPVTIVESGLVTGTTWGATVNGTHLQSNESGIAFSLPNGTYQFSADSVPGYGVSNASGTVVVSGAGQNVHVYYTGLAPGNRTYNISFIGTGLSGQWWSVRMNGFTLHSNSSGIVFTERNGTYQFTVGPPNGYSVQPSSGSAAVSGKPLSFQLNFMAAQGPFHWGWNMLLFSLAGIPITLLDIALLAGLAAVATAVTVVLRRYTKRGK